MFGSYVSMLLNSSGKACNDTLNVTLYVPRPPFANNAHKAKDCPDRYVIGTHRGSRPRRGCGEGVALQDNAKPIKLALHIEYSLHDFLVCMEVLLAAAVP